MVWAFNEIWDALSELRDKIGEFTEYCSYNATAWQSKYIVGPYVASILWHLYGFGWNLRYKVIKLRGGLEGVAGFLEGIESGWKLDDLIENIFGGWRELTDHGKRFVFNKLVGYWPDFYWFYQDPLWMLEFWLTEQWSWLQGWLDDKKVVIFEKLCDYWPDFYWFYQDPGYMLEFWLTERNPGLADFLFDMDGWVADRVGDPTEIIREWITSRMLHILQTVIENAWEGGEAD